MTAHGPPSDSPNSAASSIPTASITVRTSPDLIGDRHAVGPLGVPRLGRLHRPTLTAGRAAYDPGRAPGRHSSWSLAPVRYGAGSRAARVRPGRRGGGRRPARSGADD